MVMTLLTRPKTTVGTVVVAQDGSGHTTDIQTGIDMLPATGGCVYIKEGVYTITATITITINDVSITGCGRATEVDAVGVTAINISGSGCHIENFWLHGDGIAGTYGIEFNVAGASLYTSIINMWIDNFDTGIYDLLVGMDQSFIRGNTVYDNSNDGIRVTSGYCIVTNNVIRNSGRDGIILSGTFCNISNNFLRDSTRYGIYISTNSNIVSSNVIMRNTGVGIYLDGSNFNTVLSNEVYILPPSTQVCIYLDGDTNENKITSNYLVSETVRITDLGTINQIFDNIET